MPRRKLDYSNPVRLGLMAPLTGVVSLYGKEISRAGQIACDIVNEAGGIDGRALELVIADDGSLPDTAVPVARSLVEEKGCVALIGNLLSNTRIAVAQQVSVPLKTPYLNFSFYEGSISTPYFFHFAALPNQQIDQMIPYMAQKFGAKMYFAGSDYEWPRGSIDAAKRALMRCGGEIVGETYLALGDPDFPALLSDVARSGADVFVPYFAGAEQIALLDIFADMGLKDRMAVVMAHYDEAMAQALAPSVRRNLYSSNTYFMSVETDENRALLERLAAMPDVTGLWPDGNGVVTNFGEGTYNCVIAFAQAANAAAGLDAANLVDALKTVEFDAPQGHVMMDPDLQHAAVNNYLSRCRADGTFEIVREFGFIAPKIPMRYNRTKISSTPLQPLPGVGDVGGLVLGTGGARDGSLLGGGFLAAADVADLAIVVTDETGFIVEINPSATLVFGYEMDELVGQSLDVLLPPRVRKKHGGYFAKFANGTMAAAKMSDRSEIAGYKKNGQEFPAEASVMRFNANGRNYFAALLRETTKAKQVESELQWQATHDPLTKLPNRALLMERLNNAMRRARRQGESIALLFIDLDNFKLVNDSQGHHVGDELLKTIADRLLYTVRAGATVARFAGDEFVVLCERIDTETSAAFIAERISAEIRKPILLDETELFPTSSIGLAVGTADMSPQELMSNADAAMYSAKERGRDCWVMYNREINAQARQRLAIANGLRSAIQKNELSCVFQPIVNTQTGKAIGMETLLRWTSEDGPVSPAVFIPIAETTGSIGLLGSWVFEQACRAQKKISEIPEIPDDFYVSVNVSARQLQEPDFFEQLCVISERVGADSRRVVIEMTESTVMSDFDANVRILQALGAAGYRLAIDDFGTGYSSLSQLTTIPLSILKVDRAFVSKLETSETDLAVAKAVIGLAHALNLDVVAEGVETESQRALLIGMNTTYCQGYYFSKPKTFEDISDYLAKVPAGAFAD